ncbi:MAG TPA: hypothetical protein VFW37_08215 [Alphaproteobacteria bacterium]|nr:hypothetical protein [Alphaproteobacteria bacterium]
MAKSGSARKSTRSSAESEANMASAMTKVQRLRLGPRQGDAAANRLRKNFSDSVIFAATMKPAYQYIDL